MVEAELLTLLLDKTALYIEYPSVVKAKAFIDGYTFARQKPADPLYQEFGQWLRKKFEIRQDLNWASIVCFLGRSELGAFELAKKMWAKYLEEVQSTPH